MNRIVLGAVVALLLASAGLFWWQGRAELAQGVPPPDIAANPQANDAPIELPSANPHGRGSRLPHAPKSEASKAQQRFNRYDRNRDGKISRDEMLSTRVKAFQKLDTNHDNMLSFEEWAVKTSDRFKAIDQNHDGVITPAELQAYDAANAARKLQRRLSCSCGRPAPQGRGRPDDRGDPNEDGSGEGGEPSQ
jgi:hypothetical protein